jgi:flavin reductase (DIM6/NTAB) family NADH-FMN oxidoreductase RutF
MEPAPSIVADRAVAQAVFKDAMAETCTPVTIVTVLHDGLPHGTTVSAFASLSLDPPMVVIALNRRSELLPKLIDEGRFGVNVLRSDQGHAARIFASKAVGDRFADVGWSLHDDLPRLHGSIVWLACEVTSVAEGGDHLLITGTVDNASVRPASPLTYHRRGFGTHAPHVDLTSATAS